MSEKLPTLFTSERGIAIVTALFIVTLIAITTVAFLRVNERLARRVQISLEINQMKIEDENDLISRLVSSYSQGKTDPQLSVTDYLDAPRLKFVSLISPQSNFPPGYWVSSRWLESGVKHPDWSYLGSNLTNVYCDSGASTGTAPTDCKPSAQLGLQSEYYVGNLHLKELEVNLNSARQLYIVVLGDLQIDNELRIHGVSTSQLEIVVAGNLRIGSIEYPYDSQAPKILISAPGGNVTVEKIEATLVFESSGCPDQEKPSVRFEAGDGITLNREFQGFAIGCEFARLSRAWPSQIILGKSLKNLG